MSLFYKLISLGIVVCAFVSVEATNLFYSDEKPHYKNVVTLDLSRDAGVWNDYFHETPSTSLRMQQIEETIKGIFNSKYFICLEGCYSGEENKLFQIYGQFLLGKLKNCVAVETQYYGRSLSPHFQKYEIFLPLLSNLPKRWFISNKKYQNRDRFISTHAMECSWNFIDLGLHWMHRSQTKYNTVKFSPEEDQDIPFEELEERISEKTQGVFCKRLYDKIRKKGLLNIFTRVAVVVNGSHQYSFNTIFDTETEKQKGKKFLIDLLRY